MKIDLSGKTRKELEKLKSDIDKQINKLEEQDKKAAIAAAEKAAQAHGFTLADLAGAKAPRKGKAKAKNPPKYRNPASPDQTWSGRGRKPEWIKAAEAAGKPLSDFAI